MSFNIFTSLLMAFDGFLWPLMLMLFDFLRCLWLLFEGFQQLLMSFDAFQCRTLPFDALGCLVMAIDASLAKLIP